MQKLVLDLIQPFSNKVNIHLNMFAMLVMYKIVREIRRIDIITIDIVELLFSLNRYFPLNYNFIFKIIISIIIFYIYIFI